MESPSLGLWVQRPCPLVSPLPLGHRDPASLPGTHLDISQGDQDSGIFIDGSILSIPYWESGEFSFRMSSNL